MAKYEHKSIIYSSLLKNGYYVFHLEILEYCDKEKFNILAREQYYLDKLNPKYNILKITGSSLGYRHTSITKPNMSINNTKEKHPFFGKKHSEASKIIMSLSSINALSVKVIDVETGIEKTFNSNVKAADYLKVSE
jgi:group I intron endonuclease